MKNMRNKQYGIGFVGWCSILGILAFFVLFILRVMPLYSEKFQITKAMESTAHQPKAKGMSKTDLRKTAISPRSGVLFSIIFVFNTGKRIP